MYFLLFNNRKTEIRFSNLSIYITFAFHSGKGKSQGKNFYDEWKRSTCFKHLS